MEPGKFHLDRIRTASLANMALSEFVFSLFRMRTSRNASICLGLPSGRGDLLRGVVGVCGAPGFLRGHLHSVDTQSILAGPAE